MQDRNQDMQDHQPQTVAGLWERIRMWRERLRHPIVATMAFGVLGLFTAIALNVSFLNPVSRVVKEFSVTDIFYQILRDTGPAPKSAAVTIVDMSDLYDRRDIARCIRQIADMRPRVLGVDVLFEEPKCDVEADEMLIQVADDCRNVVYGYRLVDPTDGAGGRVRSVHSFFILPDDSAAMEGFTNVPRSLYGGMKRSASVGRTVDGRVMPSMITQIVNHYVGDTVVAVADRDLQVNFSPTDFNIIRHDSLALHPELIAGRIVLLGSLTDESDMHYTPLGKMPGVELLAYGVQTLLDQKEVRHLPAWLLAVVSFLLVWLTQIIHVRYAAFAMSRRRHLWRYLLHTTLMFSFLTFLWMSVLTWAAFVIFCTTSLNVNLGWAFGAIAFLLTGRELYRAFWGEEH